MKIACYTDIHNQQTMLNMPTVLRQSAVAAAEQTAAEWGKADISIVGGDNISDYPYWDRSCALPYENWLDIKGKLTENFKRTALLSQFRRKCGIMWEKLPMPWQGRKENMI